RVDGDRNWSFYRLDVDVVAIDFDERFIALQVFGCRFDGDGRAFARNKRQIVMGIECRQNARSTSLLVELQVRKECDIAGLVCQGNGKEGLIVLRVAA